MVARSGATEQEWNQQLKPSVEQAVQDYPRLRDQATDYLTRDPTQARDHTFQYGLDRIIAGLEARRA